MDVRPVDERRRSWKDSRRRVRWVGATAAIVVVVALFVGAVTLMALAVRRFETRVSFQNDLCGHALAVSIRGPRAFGGEVDKDVDPQMVSGCRSTAWHVAGPGVGYFVGAVVTAGAAVWLVPRSRPRGRRGRR